MRKLLLSLVALTLLVCGYALWPLLSAFEIRQAVHAGDVATLERMVHWLPVRASLRASIAALPHASRAAAGVEPVSPRPSFWGRLKAAVEPIVADHAIDAYVSPTGISRLQHDRRGVFLSILGFAKPADATTGETDVHARYLTRFLNFYAKVVHARFQSLSQVEIEIADRPDAPRHLVTLFELSGLEWKLASVRVIPARP